MFEYNTILSLTELFYLQYVLGSAIKTQDIFILFCKFYCVDDKERDEIIGLLDDKQINNIHTLNDYYRESRLKQYYREFCGGYDVWDERIEELIAIKGTTFENAQKDKLLSASEKSCGRAYDELVKLATEGVITAKRLLGIMQMKGIYITQDICAGIEQLRDAADWLDIQSLVTVIYYCETERREYLDKLYTVTQKTDYATIVEQLQIKYNIENCAISESAKMLEKAFIIGTAKRDVCSSQHLRIMCSNIISDKDKRAVMLSGNKELVPAVCGLPLRLECGKIDIVGDVKAVLNRTDERALIMRALENNDLRNRDFFRCLCICSNSEYIRDEYTDFIYDAFERSNIVQINVSSLLPIDLDATENNVFVRNCREKENNVYIIKLNGKIDERIVGLIKSLATNSDRKAVSISKLGISIDLSAVLPIFICDKRNAQLLDGSVSVVKAAEISDSEKTLVLEDILYKKQLAFSMGEITVDDAAKDMLLNLPTNKIENILDQAIMSHRTSDKPISLSAETIKEYIGDKITVGIYGFGGVHAKK